MDINKGNEEEISESGVYRSLLDVTRILEDLAQQRTPIEAYLKDGEEERPFVTRILNVEPDFSHFVVEYMENDQINRLIYSQAAIKFSTMYQGDRLNIFAYSPMDGVYQGRPAIHFPLPVSMNHYRRRYQRVPVPANAGLRCVVTHGEMEQLHLRVLDISEGGLGCMAESEEESSFAAGASLTNCRLIQADGVAIPVELAFQYAVPTLLPNGTYAHRLGLRFTAPTEAVKALARKFFK